MNAAVKYHSRETDIHPYVRHEECGDTVEEILKRLDKVEADVSILKSDVSELKSDVRDILTKIAGLATKTELSDLRGELKDLRGELKDLRGDLIQWFVGTALTMVSLAFVAAKFMH